MKFSPTIQSAMVQQPQANIANAYFAAQKQQGIRDKAALDRQKLDMEQQKFDHEMEMAPTRLEYLKNQAAVLGESLQANKAAADKTAKTNSMLQEYGVALANRDVNKMEIMRTQLMGLDYDVNKLPTEDVRTQQENLTLNSEYEKKKRLKDLADPVGTPEEFERLLGLLNTETDPETLKRIEQRLDKLVSEPKGQTINVHNQQFDPSALRESQVKDFIFGSRMNQADEIIYKLEEAVGDKGYMGAAWLNIQSSLAGGGMGNQIIEPEVRRMIQAQRNFVNAVLRRESGAVIHPDEFENARLQYFVLPGDDDETIKQKRANRRLATDSMLQAAGAPSGSGLSGQSINLEYYRQNGLTFMGERYDWADIQQTAADMGVPVQEVIRQLTQIDPAKE